MLTLLTPSAVKFIHVFNHQKHDICKGEYQTHLHASDFDCSYHKFKLTTPFTIPLFSVELFIPKYAHKSIISQYMQEDGFTQKNDLMKEAIELYNEQIFPLMELIRQTKYDVTIVEQEGEQFVMKQVPILPSKYDFEYEEGEILKDIK